MANELSSSSRSVGQVGLHAGYKKHLKLSKANPANTSNSSHRLLYQLKAVTE